MSMIDRKTLLDNLCADITSSGEIASAQYRRRMMLNRAKRQAAELTNIPDAGSLADVHKALADLAEAKMNWAAHLAGPYGDGWFNARKVAAIISDKRVIALAAIRRYKLYRDNAPVHRIADPIDLPGALGKALILGGRFDGNEWRYIVAVGERFEEFPGAVSGSIRVV
jgi:hypothetical protein